MDIIFAARKTTLKDSFKFTATKKLEKFDRFFENDAKAHITVTNNKEWETVEITIVSGSLTFRAEKNAPDRLQALDSVTDVLFKQIVKYKNKYSHKLRQNAFENLDFAEIPEETFEVVRKKQFIVKPMTVEDAILEMNMVGHNFYMFYNSQTGSYAVVYSRANGGYGLIEPGN